MKILVTGGSGFIGSNFIERCFLSYSDVKIINIDAMKTGSNPLTNRIFQNKSNYRFVKGDICNQKLVDKLVRNVDVVVNFAAESHVDRSINSASEFIKSNVTGMHTILDAIRKNQKNVRLLQISTDEVYGEVLSGKSKEQDMLNPSNPYAATKAAAEMLVKSYIRTYGIDAIITRCTNNYGPRQFPEKLIPKTIISALKNQKIPIHGTGQAKRQWIHVYDHCDALLNIIRKWKKPTIYNIGGSYEQNNLHVVKTILKLMNKSDDLIKFVKDRPGQDRRYAISANLLSKEIGFKDKIPFTKGLGATVHWYIENRKWWNNLIFEKIKNPTPWIH